MRIKTLSHLKDKLYDEASIERQVFNQYVFGMEADMGLPHGAAGNIDILISFVCKLSVQRKPVAGGARWMNGVDSSRQLCYACTALDYLNDMTITLNNASPHGLPHAELSTMSLSEVHDAVPN